MQLRSNSDAEYGVVDESHSWRGNLQQVTRCQLSSGIHQHGHFVIMKLVLMLFLRDSASQVGVSSWQHSTIEPHHLAEKHDEMMSARSARHRLCISLLHTKFPLPYPTLHYLFSTSRAPESRLKDFATSARQGNRSLE